MAEVQTVTGAVDADRLGTTLIHEHLRNSDEAVHSQWPAAGAVKEDQPYEVSAEEVGIIHIWKPVLHSHIHV